MYLAVYRWLSCGPLNAGPTKNPRFPLSDGPLELGTLQETQSDSEARGLKARSTPKRLAKPIEAKHLQRMLRNRFYIGEFTWGGVLYQGSHEPLVSEEIFAKVQSMLEAKALAGERTRKHEHYLKGTLACGRCG